MVKWTRLRRSHGGHGVCFGRGWRLPLSGAIVDGNASLRVVALAMLVAIPAHIWFTAVEGTGERLAALGIDFLLTVVMLALTCLGAIHFGRPKAMVWLAVPITRLVCLAVYYGWIRSSIWKRLEL